MLNPRRAGCIAIAALLVLSVVPIASVHAQTSSDVRAQIGQAYTAVQAAESSGGNVTALVAQLNKAVNLLDQGDRLNSTDPTAAQALYSQASSLAQSVLQAAPGVASAGRAAVLAAQEALVVETAVLGLLAVMAYLYVPRTYWRLWLRGHRDWRVKKR